MFPKKPWLKCAYHVLFSRTVAVCVRHKTNCICLHGMECHSGAARNRAVGASQCRQRQLPRTGVGCVASLQKAQLMFFGASVGRRDPSKRKFTQRVCRARVEFREWRRAKRDRQNSVLSKSRSYFHTTFLQDLVSPLVVPPIPQSQEGALRSAANRKGLELLADRAGGGGRATRSQSGEPSVQRLVGCDARRSF